MGLMSTLGIAAFIVIAVVGLGAYNGRVGLRKPTCSALWLTGDKKGKVRIAQSRRGDLR